MIIFGSRSAHLKTVNLFTSKCPSCSKSGTIDMSVFSKHAHLFWIPCFPIGKEVVAQCQHCKLVLTQKEMSEDIKAESFKLRGESKPPFWQFSGLALFAGIIVLASFSSKKDKENSKLYFENPKAGDIYQVSTDGGYSTLKIAAVDKDTVWVYQNELEIARVSKIYKIEKEENYLPLEVGMSKAELKAQYEEGKIINIERK